MRPVEGRGEPDLPDRIGRFEVTGRLGQGGMGQVLRARDPRLDREVAIKLLHADVDAERAPLQSDVARRRLMREAQAMARLDHPNVIGVHEVGEDDGRVFLVMDLVSGATLTGWLAAAPRSWREVLAVFRQVGAGLAAAHAAGMVHRDIKPDNILVGDDGRVRVTDFGLVGVDSMVSAPPPAPTGDHIDPMGATSESLPPALTHAGALVGTPGYMAPEQVRGLAADARSDQFGLCVALYEALYRQSPFVGDNFRARMLAVLDGQLQLPPASTEVPAAVTAVVLRGLTVEPHQRWADVPTLIAALDEASVAPPAPPPATPLARPPRRRWPALAAAAIVLGGGATAWRLSRGGERAATMRAAQPDARPAPVWPLPASAVETLISTGHCDSEPVSIDARTLVYSHFDHTGVDLHVHDLVTEIDRELTHTPDVAEMSPQPAHGERAVVAIPRKLDASGAGPARIDLDTGAVTELPGGAGITFGPGATTAGGALYYVLGGGTQLMELRDGVATERATFTGNTINSFTIDSQARTAVVLTGVGPCIIDLRVHAEPRCLTDLDAPYGRIAVDDAGRIYYAGLAGLRRRDPATNEDVVLIADRGANGGLAVSAAGDDLFFSECQPQIEITRLDDGAVIHTESMTRAQLNRLGAWVFIRETPSASLLAYLDPNGLIHVLTHPAQGVATDPALEPNGDRIVFFLAGPDPGFYLASGQVHKPIRKLSSKLMAGAVWVDDQHVAVTVTHDDGRPYVHLVDLDTGDDHQVLPQSRITMDRQPDGDAVLLTNDDRSRLFLWDPKRNRERELALSSDINHRQFLDGDLSPGAHTAVVRLGVEEWTVPIDPPGKPTRTYVPPGRKGYWGYEIGPDDRRYALLSEDRGELYRVRLP